MTHRGSNRLPIIKIVNTNHSKTHNIMKKLKILFIILACFGLAILQSAEKAGGAAYILATTGMVAGIAGKNGKAPDASAGGIIPAEKNAGDIAGKSPAPETSVQADDVPANLKIPRSEYNALKAKHKHLYVLDVKLAEDETYQFIAVRPSRLLIDLIAETKEVSRVNDKLIKNMIVAGDRESLDDGLVYTAVLRELAKITRQATGFLTRA